MDYLSLPLKYRPQRFEDLVGQEVIARFLSALIQKGQLARNLILYGAFGASKSTNARIYARALNCLTPTESGSPCNECDNCKMFFEQRYSDYIEFDGASKGKIDSIKEVVDIAKTPPMLGKYRVIVIDEAQGLSRQAWDALLKLIEEPPPHLVFIFTTTEINKVRAAIISRCQTLEVSLLDTIQSTMYLKRICELENFKYEDKALETISFISKGHPRDLLKNLEQVTYLGDVTLTNVTGIFNFDFTENLVNIFNNVLIEKSKDFNFNSWVDSASRKFEYLKEFLLYVYYNKVQSCKIEINPIFSLIKEQDLERLYIEGFYKSSKSCNLEIEEYFQNLFTIFNENVINTEASLILFLNHLYYYVNTLKLSQGKFGTQSVSNTSTQKEVEIRKGRIFVGDYKKQDNSKIDIIPIESECKPQTTPIYAHTLTQRGFTSKNKENLLILE